MHTLTEGSSTKLVLSINKYKRDTIINFFATTADFIESDRTNQVLAAIIKETDATNVVFPLVGKGQLSILNDLAEQIGGSLKQESVTLMRRRL